MQLYRLSIIKFCIICVIYSKIYCAIQTSFQMNTFTFGIEIETEKVKNKLEFVDTNFSTAKYNF